METHLSNFEIMQSKVFNDIPTKGTPHSWASTTRAAAARPLRRLCAASERSRRGLPEKSEEYLTSPLQAQQDVRGGESPSLKLQQDVTDGDRPYTARGPKPHGGKEVAENCVRGTIDDTARCVAQQDVHDFSGRHSKMCSTARCA